MEVKKTTQNCEIIDSGSIIIPNGEFLLFEFPDELKFKIIFEDKPDDPSDKSYRIEEIENGSILQIAFNNVSNANFGSPKNAIKLAKLNGRFLSLGFSLLSVNNRNGIEDRIFFYTWYLSKESIQEGDEN